MKSLSALALASVMVLSACTAHAVEVGITSPKNGEKVQQLITVEGMFSNMPGNGKIIVEVWDFQVVPANRVGAPVYAYLHYPNPNVADGTYTAFVSSAPGTDYSVVVTVEGQMGVGASANWITVIGSAQGGPTPPYPTSTVEDDDQVACFRRGERVRGFLTHPFRLGRCG